MLDCPDLGHLRPITLSIKCLGVKRCRASSNLVSSLSSRKQGAMDMSGKVQTLNPALVQTLAHRVMLTILRGEIFRRSINGRSCFSTGRSSRYPEYLNAAVELTDRIVEKGLGDQCRADRQRPPAHLQGTGRLVEPPCACVGGELRRQARQPRADTLRQQSGAGRGMACGHQGRRRRRQYHADASRRRTDQDRRQGGNRPGADATAASPTNWSPARRPAGSSSRS